MGELDGRKSGESEPSANVREYVREAISDNTKRAYRSDLQHFLDWGGTIPASDVVLADYLAQHAEKFSIATLVRRVASISKVHSARGIQNPTQSELVKSTLRGIKRIHGQPQRRAKPLTKEDLFTILAAMDDSLKDVRDKALLLVGFAGGLLDSNIDEIEVEDQELSVQGECARRIAIAISGVKKSLTELNLVQKLATNFWFSKTVSPFKFISEDFSTDRKPFQQKLNLRFCLESPYLDPWDLLFIDVALREDYYSFLIQRYGDCLTVQFVAWICGIQPCAPEGLAKDIIYFGSALKEFHNNNTEEGLKAAQTLRASGGFPLFSVQWESNGLLELGKLAEFINLMAEHVVASKIDLTLIPLERFFATRVWSDLRCFAGEIDLAILVDAHWYQTGLSELNS